MRWLVSGCFLGGIGVLIDYWQWPFARWASFAGVAVLMLGFLRWLGTPGRGAGQAQGGSGDAGHDAGPIHDCGDGGGGDGGCGGD